MPRALFGKTTICTHLLRSPLVCLQARSVRCEPDEVDEQKARRRIRRYVFLRVQRTLAMRIVLRSIKILMDSLVRAPITERHDSSRQSDHSPISPLTILFEK